MVMEKASSDEGYLDVSLCCDSMHQARTLAEQLQDYLLSAVGMRVSVGCARNKLMAKLASTVAKQPGRVKSGGRRVVVVGGIGEGGLEGGLLEEGQLLREMNVLKLPGDCCSHVPNNFYSYYTRSKAELVAWCLPCGPVRCSVLLVVHLSLCS